MVAAMVLVEIGYADAFTSVNGGGAWDDPSTWDKSAVPGVNDDVVIGWNHVITSGSSTNLTVKSLSNSGTLTINGSLVVMDILSVGWDKSIAVSGNLTLYNDFTNSGSLEVGGNFTINNGGNLTNADNKLISVGNNMDIAGDVINSGIINISGNCDINGALTNNDSDQFLVGGNLTVDQGVTNSGTFNVAGSSNITGGLTNNDSDFLYLGTSATIVGDVVNIGTLVSGGDLDITGNITNNNLDLIVVNGNFTKDGDLSSQGYLVVGGDYSSLSGETLINDTQGDFYVIGINNCTNSECTEILDFTEWIVLTPGLPYLSSVTAEFDVDGSFTIPSGISTIMVECWGGGGGGGNASHNGNHNSRGGGGAGGAYAAATITNASGTYYYTIGSGGSGGSDGTPTSFVQNVTIYVEAEGGAQGGNANRNNATGGIGSASNSIGDIVFPGGNGGNASNDGSGAGGGGAGSQSGGKNASGTNAGGATDDFGGGGGVGLTQATTGGYNGDAGNIYGGGGSGGLSIGNTASDGTGGSGANGKVRITMLSGTHFLSFEDATTTVTEQNTIITINIQLNTPYTEDIDIGVSVGINSTAANGIDYTFDNTVVTIYQGETSTSFDVSILNNSVFVGSRDLYFILSPPSSINLVKPDIHRVIIEEDEEVPGSLLSVSDASICLDETVQFTADFSDNCSFIDHFYYSTDNSTWQSITVSFDDATGECIENYTPTSTGVSYYYYTWYRNGGHNGTSNIVSVSVNPLPQGSLSANGPFCTPETGQLTWTATEGTGPFEIVYNDGTTDYSVMNVYSGTPFDVENNPVNTTTTYTLQSVTDANGCNRSTDFTTASATIEIEPLSVTVKQVTADYECPQLFTDLGFNPNNDGPYNPGSSEIMFSVKLEEPASDWNFNFDVEAMYDITSVDIDSVNILGTHYDLTGTSPYSYNDVPQTTDSVGVHVWVKNIPGEQVKVIFDVSEISDDNCTSTFNEEKRDTIIMNVMPVVGRFE